MPLETKTAYLLLGTNLGDRELYLKNTLAAIAKEVGEIKCISSVYETAAWGKTDQPGFLNMAVEVATTLNPITLLHTVLGIEKALGRIRHEKWGARLIDIDIILFADEIIDRTAELQIPHPEMQNRKFVLEPLAEIAADVMHPVLKKTMKTLLAELSDDLEVVKLS